LKGAPKKDPITHNTETWNVINNGTSKHICVMKKIASIDVNLRYHGEYEQPSNSAAPKVDSSSEDISENTL
jgi:hypothetical protein